MTSWVVDPYPNARKVKGRGQTFLDHFKLDRFLDNHKLNLYYLFSTLEDWQMANFLLTSQLSMRAIDDFLSLTFVMQSA